MKKIAFSATLIALIGIAAFAFAKGAVKVEFVPWGGAVGVHADANGFVVLNSTPKAFEYVVTVQVRDAAPNFEYYVKTGGQTYGTFTTNKQGNGHLSFKIAKEDAVGSFINVRIGVTGPFVLRAPIP